MARSLVTGLCVLCAVAGCSSSEEQVNAFLHDWEASVSASEYRVQPPDLLEFSSAQAPEIDAEQQIVRQDGKVSLRLVGDVKVAGLTPVEISRKLESLLEKYYVEPQVGVRVMGNGSKRFYVFGQVGRPGPYHYTGRDSLLYVLAAAQPTFLAWKSQIKVIHPSHEEGRRSVMTVDADKMLKQGHLEQNILLQEGDIVYVPATPLAWVGLRIREVLWPVDPILSAARTPSEVTRTGDLVSKGETYRGD
jgi:polysaccharide export outer membrane protein